jgi:hypothetical protein
MDGRLDGDEEKRGLYDMANGQDRKDAGILAGGVRHSRLCNYC